MIDFDSNLDAMPLALATLHLGWPGLLIGAVLGLWAWRDRRSFGVALGGFFGVSVWAAVHVAFF